jgi:hypothetical protein
MFEVPFTGEVEIARALKGMQGLKTYFIYYITCIKKVLYGLI